MVVHYMYVHVHVPVYRYLVGAPMNSIRFRFILLNLIKATEHVHGRRHNMKQRPVAYVEYLWRYAVKGLDRDALSAVELG